METPNTNSLRQAWLDAGVSPEAVRRMYHSFNAWAEPFRTAGETDDA